ncbi:MAG: NADH-quinone oxidoreductase subunit L, partial [Neisseriaceae bacterium]|nr:NADH-quinone oxidoreductase subunit L [Neisseriaceae bacterium]
MDKMSLYLIIVLAPLFGSLLAGLFGKQIGKIGAHTVTILGLLVSTALSCYILKGFITGEEAVFNENLYTWLTVGNSLTVSVGFMVDQ